ncbi:hypothetical protein ACKI2N_016675 [Cupriavidus sp. 30B13]|uniref:hypothetical protein n=1 Tax=Cupriavidus sp. 30B13 TaxID=3384241 RepID=UPI003B8F339B
MRARKNPKHRGDDFARAPRGLFCRADMLARGGFHLRWNASRARRAHAKSGQAMRNDEDDEVVMRARKFFCTFFLTSPNKRIMIRLDKSLTSLHGCGRRSWQAQDSKLKTASSKCRQARSKCEARARQDEEQGRTEAGSPQQDPTAMSDAMQDNTPTTGGRRAPPASMQ